MSKLPASTGWLWLKSGFRMFGKQPGILMMLMFTSMLLVLLLSNILPLVGSIIATILLPAFGMAILQACHLIEQGQRVHPRVLLIGFQQGALAPLCRLGAVYAAISLVLAVLLQLTVADSLAQIKVPIDATKASQIDPGVLMAVMGIGLLQSVAFVLLCFAPPLTYWKKMKLGKALFYSIFGVLGALKPMLTMLLAWIGIFMLAGSLTRVIFGATSAGQVLTMWLIMLFTLILQCAIYASYRQIFGDPDAVDLTK